MAQNQHTVGIKITAEDKASAIIKSSTAALAHARSGYESLADYMKREASEAQKVATANQQAATATKNAGDAAEGASGGFSSLFKTFTLANLAANAIQSGVQIATQSIKDAVKEATNYERALMGLNTAATAFGVTTEAVNGAVKTVTSDGLLGFTTAATALKTLLSTGMSLDEAIPLLQRFKDEAAFGRSETLDYSTAVRNLAQAYKTNSSELGDMSGHTDNFSNAIEAGANALGKTTAQLTTAETAQAKYIGYMQQGAGAAGNAAAYTDTYAGSVSRMEAEQDKAAASMGTNFLPALEYLTTSMTSFMQSTSNSGDEMQEFQSYLVTLAAVVRSVAQVVVGSAQIMYGAIKSVMTLSWDPLAKGVEQAADGFIDTWDDAYKQYEKIYSQGADNQIGTFGSALDSMVSENGVAQRKMQQQVEDANRQFARSMEQRTKQFSESLRDMVISHRDKSRAIQSDIASEDAAYAKSALMRQKDYQDDLLGLEERHLEKVSDIEKDIAKERAAGFAVDGVVFHQANEEKIRDLEASLAKERTAYQKSVDKRKNQYAEDVAEDKARHDEKILQLQTALAQETAILEQHRADVAAVGEAQKEDDLSRLKRQYAEANVEAARNHAEQLEKIRKSGVEQGAAFGGSFAKEQAKGLQTAQDQHKQAMTQVEQASAEAGSASAKSMWESFTNGLGQWFKNWPQTISNLFKDIDKSTGAITGAATLLKFLPSGGAGGDALLKLLNLPKKAGGGDVQSGRPYWVGDNKDGTLNKTSELFVPGQSGQIYNQQQLSQMVGGASGKSTSINIGSVVMQNNMDIDSFLGSLSWHIK